MVRLAQDETTVAEKAGSVQMLHLKPKHWPYFSPSSGEGQGRDFGNLDINAFKC